MTLIKPHCGACKHVDKTAGWSNWRCTSEEAWAGSFERLPSYFPRVLFNDKCPLFRALEAAIEDRKALLAEKRRIRKEAKEAAQKNEG